MNVEYKKNPFQYSHTIKKGVVHNRWAVTTYLQSEKASKTILEPVRKQTTCSVKLDTKLQKIIIKQNFLIIPEINASHEPVRWSGTLIRFVTHLRAFCIEFTHESVSSRFQHSIRFIHNQQFASDRRVVQTYSARHFPATLPPFRFRSVEKTQKQ